MLLLDPKFAKNKHKYVVQTVMVTLVMLLLFLVLDAERNGAILTALGASSFIAFTMPHHNVSRPRYLIGGYSAGIVAGTVCHYALRWAVAAHLPLLTIAPNAVFGSLAVGMAIFLMVLSNMEHPPAAGVALGLVFNEQIDLVILVVIMGIIALATTKTLLKSVLMDLL